MSYHPEEVEDAILYDYREDVAQLLLVRQEPHALDEDDQLVIAAHFDRGSLVHVCATAVRHDRQQRQRETSTDNKNHSS